jgi:hypothetical protein
MVVLTPVSFLGNSNRMFGSLKVVRVIDKSHIPAAAIAMLISVVMALTALLRAGAHKGDVPV